MYRHAAHYVWVDWEHDGDDPPDDGRDYSGFRARILRNPTARQVRAETQAFIDWLDQAKPDAGPDEYYQTIADRVIAWEYELPNAAGEWEAVPAPGEAPDNWQAFLLLPPELAGWLIRQVRTAHLPKATTPASPPAGTTEPASPNGTHPATAPLGS
jgi:hypothetical protein